MEPHIGATQPTHTVAEHQFAFSNEFTIYSLKVLLLGGYTISSAFARCQLELRLASWLQRRLGPHPKYFILAVMMLGTWDDIHY